LLDQLSAGILPSLIKGAPRTKQNVDPAVHFVYSRVKIEFNYVVLVVVVVVVVVERRLLHQVDGQVTLR
jgi:hypothetical protein